MQVRVGSLFWFKLFASCLFAHSSVLTSQSNLTPDGPNPGYPKSSSSAPRLSSSSEPIPDSWAEWGGEFPSCNDDERRWLWQGRAEADIIVLILGVRPCPAGQRRVLIWGGGTWVFSSCGFPLLSVAPSALDSLASLRLLSGLLSAECWLLVAAEIPRRSVLT